MVTSYKRLGDIYAAGGDTVRAEEMMLNMLKLAEKLDLKEDMAVACGNLGFIHRARGERESMCAAWTTALTIFRKIGNEPGAKRTQDWMQKEGCPESATCRE